MHNAAKLERPANAAPALPRRRPNAVDHRQFFANPPARAGALPAGECSLMATGNILIADDDTAIRTVLSQALSRAGYEVRATGAAATLWRWVQSGDGDL